MVEVFVIKDGANMEEYYVLDYTMYFSLYIFSSCFWFCEFIASHLICMCIRDSNLICSYVYFYIWKYVFVADCDCQKANVTAFIKTYTSWPNSVKFSFYSQKVWYFLYLYLLSISSIFIHQLWLTKGHYKDIRFMTKAVWNINFTPE